jgi:hypothetical protein
LGIERGGLQALRVKYWYDTKRYTGWESFKSIVTDVGGNSVGSQEVVAWTFMRRTELNHKKAQ